MKNTQKVTGGKKKQDGVRGDNGDNEDSKFDDGDELMINGSKMGVGL